MFSHANFLKSISFANCPNSDSSKAHVGHPPPQAASFPNFQPACISNQAQQPMKRCMPSLSKSCPPSAQVPKDPEVQRPPRDVHRMAAIPDDAPLRHRSTGRRHLGCRALGNIPPHVISSAKVERTGAVCEYHSQRTHPTRYTKKKLLPCSFPSTRGSTPDQSSLHHTPDDMRGSREHWREHLAHGANPEDG